MRYPDHNPRPGQDQAGPFDSPRRGGHRHRRHHGGPGPRGFGDDPRTAPERFGPDPRTRPGHEDLGPEDLGAEGFGPRGGGAPREGFGPHGRRGPGPRGRRRAGRGDVRLAVLALLAEQPMHGYQLIQEITERSNGAWRPSPGAVYPALNLLQDEGLVVLSADAGRRLASLTEAGQAYVAEHAAELAAPFTGEDDGAHRSRAALRTALDGLAGAARQVARSGDDAQVAQAVTVLDDARRALYLTLAGEPVASARTEAPSDDGREARAGAQAAAQSDVQSDVRSDVQPDA